jgi:hypothetical protein
VDSLGSLASLTPALGGTVWFPLVSDLFIPVQPGPQNAWRSGIRWTVTDAGGRGEVCPHDLRERCAIPTQGSPPRNARAPA